MPTDIIRYDLLVQEALRSVVRKVLADAAQHGLPGDHYFYITFRTDAPGVRISPRTKERFPEEITIILQHQFWDLSVSEQGFEVGLSFQNIPEKLFVPWETIRGFFDPSVEFGLKFEVEDGEPETGANDTEPSEAPAPAPAPAPARLTPKAPRGAGSEPAEAPAKGKSKPPAAAATDKSDTPSGDAKVVSIDAFRKKT
jgi:hypothetical protein